MKLFARKKKSGGMLPADITLGMHIYAGHTRLVYLIILSLTALLGITGSVFSFITACEANESIFIEHKPVYITILLSWAVLSVFYALSERFPKISRGAVCLFIIGLVIFAAINSEKLDAGFRSAANDFLGALYKKYRDDPVFDVNTVWEGYKTYPQEKSMTIAVCWLSAVISVLCCRMVKRPNALLFICVTFPLPELCLYFGMVPGYGFFLMALVSWCAAAAAEIWGVFPRDISGTGGILKKTAAQCAACAGLIITLSFAGSMLYSDITGHERGESADDFRENTMEYFRTFSWQKFMEDINIALFSFSDNIITHDGKLGTNDKVKFTGESMLEVTLPVNSDTLYLKGFTGEIYNGSRWAEGTEQIVLETKLTSVEFFSGRVLKTLEPYRGSELMYVVVRNTGALNNIKYYPMNSAGLLESDGRRRRYGVYFPSGDWRSYILDNEGRFALSGTLETDEEKLREYAYETCLDVPEGFDCADEFFADYRGNSDKELLSYIRMHMSEICEYTLDAGKKPFGSDFAKWFLTENKKGSCTHFATAGVMLCRSQGIPARYCEGFIIKESDMMQYSADGDYVTVTVPDNRAHAWAEVYVDGYGWMNYEFTPGYGNVYADREEEKQPEETSASEITHVETEAPRYSEDMSRYNETEASENTADSETVTTVTQEIQPEFTTADTADTEITAESSDVYGETGGEGTGQGISGMYTTVTGEYSGGMEPESTLSGDEEYGEEYGQTETAQSGRDDETENQPPKHIPAAVKAVAVFLAAVMIIAAGYYGVRKYVFYSRRRLITEKPRKAAVRIYHMLVRFLKVKPTVTGDELSKYISAEFGIDSEICDIIVSNAMRARFGQGIVSSDSEASAEAYRRAAAVITGAEGYKQVLSLIFMYDRYI